MRDSRRPAQTRQESETMKPFFSRNIDNKGRHACTVCGPSLRVKGVSVRAALTSSRFRRSWPHARANAVAHQNEKAVLPGGIRREPHGGGVAAAGQWADGRAAPGAFPTGDGDNLCRAARRESNWRWTLTSSLNLRRTRVSQTSLGNPSNRPISHYACRPRWRVSVRHSRQGAWSRRSPLRQA